MLVNNFYDSLNYEKNNAYLLHKTYKLLWPTLTSIRINADRKLQSQGVDKFIDFENGILKIEEKFRKNWYGDILLEYISVDYNNTPGWMEKLLICDYIFYAIIPINKVYWFYYPELKQLWDTYKNCWIYYGEKKQHGFTKIVSKNRTYNKYNTISVGVKPELLLNSISQSGFHPII